MGASDGARVAVCSVGDELLSGAVVDTNAAWLLARVVEAGGQPAEVAIVGDAHDHIVAVLRRLLARADVVVVGGGLGPTPDDLTRDAVAALAEVDLARRPELVAHLDGVYERLERDMPEAALRQADVPVGARVHAPRGSAAGFSVDVEVEGRAAVLHVLPGVPWEYRELAERVVLPDVVARSGGRAHVVRAIHVAGLGESGVGEVLAPLTDASPPDVRIAFQADDGEVLVRVTGTGDTPSAARERAAEVVVAATELLGDAVTSVDDQRLEDEVARLLARADADVATVEVGTGGRLAAAVTTAPGTTGRLRSGVAVPDLDAAAGALGLSGTVGASELAVAARDRTGATWGVALLVTADPGRDAAVGDTRWAIVGPDGSVRTAERFVPAADRDVVRTRSAAFVMEALRRQLVASTTSRPVADVTP